jgi:hypothetical protein
VLGEANGELVDLGPLLLEDLLEVRDHLPVGAVVGRDLRASAAVACGACGLVDGDHVREGNRGAI